MTAQADPSTIFVEYRPGRRRWRLVLVAAGVLGLLVASVYVVRATVSSPESAVTAYFDALADRDPAAALAVTAPEVAGQVPRDAINREVLGSADYTPPTDVEVAGVTVHGRSAVAEVAYTIDGQPHTGQLRLRRDDGIVDAVVHRWLVVDAIGSLILGEVPEQITVNGTRVAARDAQGPRVLPVLPGGYRVGVPDGDPLWQARSVVARVAAQDATEVDVPLVPQPAVREEVDRQVRALLDECAASTELLPPGCPFGYAVVARAENVSWRIASYPHVELAPGQDPAAGGLVLATARAGEAVITGTRRFVGEFEASVPVPITGTVTMQGGAVTLHPGW